MKILIWRKKQNISVRAILVLAGKSQSKYRGNEAKCFMLEQLLDSNFRFWNKKQAAHSLPETVLWHKRMNSAQTLVAHRGLYVFVNKRPVTMYFEIYTQLWQILIIKSKMWPIKERENRHSLSYCDQTTFPIAGCGSPLNINHSGLTV